MIFFSNDGIYIYCDKWQEESNNNLLEPRIQFHLL